MATDFYSDGTIWLIALVLGVGTFALRYSFLGVIGNRNLPEWVLRYLRYTSVAVLPALVSPLVIWPQATGGAPDPARLAAAAAALAAGIALRNVLAAIVAGFATLYLMLWLVG